MPASESQGSASAITWAQRRVLVGLGLLHSLFLAIAFWPEVSRFGLHLLVVPAVWALAGVVRCAETWNAVKPRYIAYWGALGVLPFWAFEQAWMTRIAGLAAVGPLVLAHTVHTFLILWITVRARRRWPSLPLWLVFATVWAGVEFFRGDIGFDGYPWYFIAHPLVDWHVLRAPVAVVGVYGLNWLVVALATAMFEARIGRGGWALWREGGRVMWAPAGLLVAWGGLAGLGLADKFDSDSSPRNAIRVAVIQTNVPQDVKLGWSGFERMQDLSRFMTLTRRAAALEPKPDVIVWPETMFPGEALDEASAEVIERAQMMFVVDGERDEMLMKIRALPGLEDVQVYVMRDGERGPRCGIAMEEPNKRVLALQQEIGIPMIVGGIAYDGLTIGTRAGEATTWQAKHNSAFLIDRAGARASSTRYDKMKLTPFGEVMPYVSHWPWLERVFMRIGAGAGGMKFDLVAGDQPVVFEIPHAWTREHTSSSPQSQGSIAPGVAKVATPICFEATIAHVCRRLARGPDGSGGADLFIQITNDGWFGAWNPGRYEHLRLARWRCTELGLAMVRAANTGISCKIDASGAVVERGLGESFTQANQTAWDIDREGIAAYSVAFGDSTPTIYRRVGDMAGWAAMIGAIGLGVVSSGWVKRARPARA